MKNIYSWNVNGIRAIEKKGFVEWVKKANPDILAIQETKAHREQLPAEIIHIEGYTSYFFSAQKRGYSGVALYTKEKPLSVEPLGDLSFDGEGRTIIAQYDGWTLVNCYFPNSQAEGKRLDYKIAFCDAVLEKCDQLVQNSEKVLLCGDYNIAHKPIDLKNPQSNENNPGYLPEEREWMTKFLNAGYDDTFRRLHSNEPGHYTWWSYRFQARAKDIGWRIDYHCVNEDFKGKVVESSIHKSVMGSDHCPISIKLDI
ncbi:MAG: exodeoxyribonuclease III [Candidatus Marinimicrobia bacterium]|nr:exodeoxyribonuclease III [Candidatus Neomarinimicrobiota bacterium]